MSSHTVQFYRDDKSLFATVAAFVVGALSKNEPAVIIATPPHRTGILAVLAQALDVTTLQQAGRLIVRDADEVLAGFMRHDMPDQVLFEERVTRFVEATAGVEKQMVHAYGEMVNLLWQRGMPAAALALEACWSRLAERYTLSLFCGYSLDTDYDGAAFDSICGMHSHIVSTSGHVRVPL